MGFEARIIFLQQGSGEVDQPGSRGEVGCTVWQDTRYEVDFGHITRLEKVSGERFKHLSHTPFRRAGICVVDCFLRNLGRGLKEKITEQFAPEILIPKSFLDGEDDSIPLETTKIGGRTYVDCLLQDFKSML